MSDAPYDPRRWAVDRTRDGLAPPRPPEQVEFTRNKTQRLAAQRERQARVLELRKTGMTFAAIAVAVGYKSAAGAAMAYRRAMDRIIDQPAEEVRDLELQRLDHLLGIMWEQVEKNHLCISHGHVVTMKERDPKTGEAREVPVIDHGKKAEAVDRVLKIMERRARYLGLDAPQRIEVFTPEAIDAEIERLQRIYEEYERSRGRPTNGGGPLALGPASTDSGPTESQR